MKANNNRFEARRARMGLPAMESKEQVRDINAEIILRRLEMELKDYIAADAEGVKDG